MRTLVSSRLVWGRFLTCSRFSIGFCIAVAVYGQPAGANYDESKVGNYKLPDPLVLSTGEPVRDKGTWEKRRRPEILRMFEKEMFGRSPGKPQGLAFELKSIDKSALAGKAVRKEVTVLFNGKQDGPKMDLLLYLPANAKGPVPVFLGLNFTGNHTVTSEPGISVTKSWMRGGKVGPRGASASRWPVERALERGYGVATAYYGDIDPDFDDGFTNGVHALYGKPGPDEWGSIGAWAWGLSRALDYLETDKDVNAKQVVLHGHSRLGKAALWAGAQDQRFAMVVSNDSGEGGAAISRRDFGETVKRINTAFPHWFAANYKKYNDNPNNLPFDSHMLIALIAPRPVYVASASEDLWADPHGELLGAYQAGPVYRLYGKQGLKTSELPPVQQPMMTDAIAYHLREGKHDITAYDWDRYMDFADRHFKGKR